MTVISGVVCWFWLASGGAGPAKSVPPNVSELTEVEESDIADALRTLSPSDAVLAKIREAKDRTCQPPLAWVSVVSAPGEPPGQLRLISGNYVSPIFDVSAIPVRVALPYPAPYERGHGELTAVDAGGSATIALLPAWRVSAPDGRTTRAVIWHPLERCSPRNG